jgi:hypothetical protein
LKEMKSSAMVSTLVCFPFFASFLISYYWLKERYFKRDPAKPNLQEFLDGDGLPYPGTYLKQNDPYYWYVIFLI